MCSSINCHTQDAIQSENNAADQARRWQGVSPPHCTPPTVAAPAAALMGCPRRHARCSRTLAARPSSGTAPAAQPYVSDRDSKCGPGGARVNTCREARITAGSHLRVMARAREPAGGRTQDLEAHALRYVGGLREERGGVELERGRRLAQRPHAHEEVPAATAAHMEPTQSGVGPIGRCGDDGWEGRGDEGHRRHTMRSSGVFDLVTCSGLPWQLRNVRRLLLVKPP